MPLKRDYARGNPVGSGKMTPAKSVKGINFDVIDISGSGIQIEAPDGVSEGEDVRLVLEITGALFEKNLDLSGKVARKIPQGDKILYAIKLTRIDPDDRIEIDEIINYLNTFHSEYSEGLVFDENIDSSINWLSNIKNGIDGKDS